MSEIIKKIAPYEQNIKSAMMINLISIGGLAVILLLIKILGKQK